MVVGFVLWWTDRVRQQVFGVAARSAAGPCASRPRAARHRKPPESAPPAGLGRSILPYWTATLALAVTECIRPARLFLSVFDGAPVRIPHLFAGSLLLALVLAACGSSAGDRTTAPAPSAATVAPSPAPEVRTWGGFAVSISYGSFAEWARETTREAGTGVALVRIVDVSPVRWSTASREGPGPADIARANRAEVDFGIGRLVTVERVRIAPGTWPVAGDTALYWLPGGQIGNDRTPVVYDLPDPAPVRLPLPRHGPAPISTERTAFCGRTSTGFSRPIRPGAFDGRE